MIPEELLCISYTPYFVIQKLAKKNQHILDPPFWTGFLEHALHIDSLEGIYEAVYAITALIRRYVQEDAACTVQ
jgi:hypothetical protein